MRLAYFLIVALIAAVVTPARARLGAMAGPDRDKVDDTLIRVDLQSDSLHNSFDNDLGDLDLPPSPFFADWNWMNDISYHYYLSGGDKDHGLGHFDRGVCDDCHETMGPEYGWRFVYRDFGTENGPHNPKWPYYILYNFATGILRVFYRTYNHCEDKTYHQVSLFYASSDRANSAFTFSSEDLAIDHPDSQGNKEVAINECTCGNWCFVDLPTSYDPNRPPRDSFVYIKIAGITKADINLLGGVNLEGEIGEASVSYPETPSVFDVISAGATEAWSFYKQADGAFNSVKKAITRNPNAWYATDHVKAFLGISRRLGRDVNGTDPTKDYGQSDIRANDDDPQSLLGPLNAEPNDDKGSFLSIADPWDVLLDGVDEYPPSSSYGAPDSGIENRSLVVLDRAELIDHRELAAATIVAIAAGVVGFIKGIIGATDSEPEVTMPTPIKLAGTLTLTGTWIEGTPVDDLGEFIAPDVPSVSPSNRQYLPSYSEPLGVFGIEKPKVVWNFMKDLCSSRDWTDCMARCLEDHVAAVGSCLFEDPFYRLEEPITIHINPNVQVTDVKVALAWEWRKPGEWYSVEGFNKMEGHVNLDMLFNKPPTEYWHPLIAVKVDVRNPKGGGDIVTIRTFKPELRFDPDVVPRGYARLYANDSYRGQYLTLKSKRQLSSRPYDGWIILHIGNDRASSVRVGPDTWATLYEHENWQGRSRIIPLRSSNLGDLNNKVSSLKTESSMGKIKACPERDFSGGCVYMPLGVSFSGSMYNSILIGRQAGTVRAYYDCGRDGERVRWRLVTWMRSVEVIRKELPDRSGARTCRLSYFKKM